VRPPEDAHLGVLRLCERGEHLSGTALAVHERSEPRALALLEHDHLVGDRREAELLDVAVRLRVHRFQRWSRIPGSVSRQSVHAWPCGCSSYAWSTLSPRRSPSRTRFCASNPS